MRDHNNIWVAFKKDTGERWYKWTNADSHKNVWKTEVGLLRVLRSSGYNTDDFVIIGINPSIDSVEYI